MAMFGRSVGRGSAVLSLLLLMVGVTSVRADFAIDLARAAEERANHGVVYDPSYVRIDYPNGDVPKDRGVCTDVVIRAYRALGIDLQRLVHEDMRRSFGRYPKIWGAKRPDANIDHRRVPNLETFLSRRGAALKVTSDAARYRPGDVVTWRLENGRAHMGIVTTRTSPGGVPLIAHNIGAGPQVEDVLFAYRIHRHFRWYGDG